MKRVVIAVLYMVLSSVILNAKDDIFTSKTFIGLEVGYADVQGDVGHLEGSDVVIEPNFNGDDDVEFGFRIGAQNDEWRTTFIFDYYDSSDNDQNIEKGYLTLDYLLLEKESTVRPYIGLNIGYANYESSYVDDSGFLYGAQAGIILDVADVISLDLGYRYTLSDANALDHIGSVILGVNYMF
jgi:opacity protein-like surface antigen